MPVRLYRGNNPVAVRLQDTYLRTLYVKFRDLKYNFSANDSKCIHSALTPLSKTNTCRLSLLAHPKLLQTECGQSRALHTLHDFPCKPTLQHCSFSSLNSRQKDSCHHLVAFTKITEAPLNAFYFLPPVTKAIGNSCLFHLQTSSLADLLPRALPNIPLQTTIISCQHC